VGPAVGSTDAAIDGTGVAEGVGGAVGLGVGVAPAQPTSTNSVAPTARRRRWERMKIGPPESMLQGDRADGRGGIGVPGIWTPACTLTDDACRPLVQGPGWARVAAPRTWQTLQVNVLGEILHALGWNLRIRRLGLGMRIKHYLTLAVLMASVGTAIGYAIATQGVDPDQEYADLDRAE